MYVNSILQNVSDTQNYVIYSMNFTPIVNDITPFYGDIRGGTKVYLDGSGFGN